MGRIYNSDIITLRSPGGSGGTRTVNLGDDKQPDASGNVQLNAYTPENPPPSAAETFGLTLVKSGEELSGIDVPLAFTILSQGQGSPLFPQTL